jgi:DNA-binding NarL/FixJ family response regulator
MTLAEHIHVAVADASVIARYGLMALLKHLDDWPIHPVEAANMEALNECMEVHAPAVVIVNPTFDRRFDVKAFREQYAEGGVKIVALVTALMPPDELKEYDGTIPIYEDVEYVHRLFHTLMQDEDDDEGGAETLSQREKEVIGCVVRGLSNKETAERLFLSVHTVITHRRNIARKLQIHSPAGLTIYAIVNKLVDLNEVKMD